MNYQKSVRKLIRISMEIRTNKRIRLTQNKKQTLLEEFFRPSWDSKEHRNEKMKIAESLIYQGKEIFIEKCITIDGIRIRPDICYFENGKLSIIEVEFGGNGQNNIFRNFDAISKVANIRIFDVVYDIETKKYNSVERKLA